MAADVRDSSEPLIGAPPPIVYLLHGLLATAHHQFAPQVRAWKEELAVVPLDLPGHGRCVVDARPPYIAWAVRYALAVLARFGPGHVVAASYLGVPVAVNCALQRPELVRSLVLTGFVPDVPGAVFATWLDGFRRLAAENPELIRWYEESHGRRWQDTLAAYVDDARERYAEVVCVRGERLGRLRPPTLIANGSQKSNERTTAREATRFGAAIHGHVIEGAGHIAGLDRPDDFNGVVRAFWKESLHADAALTR